MNGVTMILPGDVKQPAQTPFEAWLDRQLKRVPFPAPSGPGGRPTLPVPGAMAPDEKPGGGGQGQNPGASRPSGVFPSVRFCLGADEAICGGLAPGFGRDTCIAASNIACLTLGIIVLLVLAALAFVPQKKPGVGLAIVAVLLLGWAWRSGRLPLAAQAARGM